jgi:hypothetical protein
VIVASSVDALVNDSDNAIAPQVDVEVSSVIATASASASAPLISSSISSNISPDVVKGPTNDNSSGTVSNIADGTAAGVSIPKGRNKPAGVNTEMSVFTFKEEANAGSSAYLHTSGVLRDVNNAPSSNVANAVGPGVLTSSNAFQSERNFKEKDLAENKEFLPDIHNLNTSDRKIVEKDLEIESNDEIKLEKIEAKNKIIESESNKVEHIEKKEEIFQKIVEEDLTAKIIPENSETSTKKKEDIFNRLDKLNLDKFSSEDNNNSNINALESKQNINTNRNKFKPVKKSLKILEIAKSLEEHLYGESDIISEVLSSNNDATTKILLDKPVQKNKKKMSKFSVGNLNLQ